MAILKDLIVLGNGNISGHLVLNKSGEVKENDYRVVDGDTVARASQAAYKEVLHTPGDNSISQPILIDSLVKNTRKIVIRVLPPLSSDSLAYIPRTTLLYDPDNWISSNVTSSNPLDIIFVQFENNRSVPINDKTGAISEIPDIPSNLNVSRWVHFVKIAKTGSEIVSGGTSAAYITPGSDSTASMIDMVFKGTSIVLKMYDGIDGIGAAGLIKYLT